MFHPWWFWLRNACCKLWANSARNSASSIQKNEKRKTKNTSKTDKTPFARVGRHTIFCTIAFEEWFPISQFVLINGPLAIKDWKNRAREGSLSQALVTTLTAGDVLSVSRICYQWRYIINPTTQMSLLASKASANWSSKSLVIVLQNQAKHATPMMRLVWTLSSLTNEALIRHIFSSRIKKSRTKCWFQSGSRKKGMPTNLCVLKATKISPAQPRAPFRKNPGSCPLACRWRRTSFQVQLKICISMEDHSWDGMIIIFQTIRILCVTVIIQQHPPHSHLNTKCLRTIGPVLAYAG